jgi:hypothetical protein
VKSYLFKNNDRSILFMAKGKYVQLLYVYFYFLLERVCKVATTTRNSASIETKPSYAQHITVGILLRSNLTNPVIQALFSHKKL